jgi:hypothetical protein
VIAFTHAGYVAAGWIAGLGALGAYALRIVLRGRKLSAQVPPEDRRWS